MKISIVINLSCFTKLLINVNAGQIGAKTIPFTPLIPTLDTFQ